MCFEFCVVLLSCLYAFKEKMCFDSMTFITRWWLIFHCVEFCAWSVSLVCAGLWWGRAAICWHTALEVLYLC